MVLADVAGRRPVENTRSLTLDVGAERHKRELRHLAPIRKLVMGSCACCLMVWWRAVLVLPPLAGDWIVGGTGGAGQDSAAHSTSFTYFLCRLISGDIDTA
eukprot:COSAG05_NODE_109_length_18675_cov_6.774279_13_plen_101_part_00